MNSIAVNSGHIDWFKREVVIWRTGAATAWSMIFAVSLAFIFVVVSNISLFNPVWSLLSCLLLFVELKFWTLVLFLIAAVGLSCYLNIRQYRVTCDVPLTRFEFVFNQIRPRRVTFILGHMLTTGAASWCAVQLLQGRYNNLSRPCQHDVKRHCFNEFHMFIVLFGGIYGAASSVMFLHSGRHVLRFPPVVQRKLFDMKSQFWELLYDNARQVFMFLKYYCLVYYILASTVKRSIIFNFNLEYDKDVPAIDTIYGLFDIPLLLSAWLAVTFATVVISLPHLLYTIYHQELYEFPIEPMLGGGEELCLHTAIGCREYLPLQFLACVDVTRLAKYSPLRRRQVFNLAALSSHPVNWNNLSIACLTELDLFLELLSTYAATTTSLPVSSIGHQPHAAVSTCPPRTTLRQRLATVATTAHVNRSIPEFSEIVGDTPNKPKIDNCTDNRSPVVLLMSKVWSVLLQRPWVVYIIQPTLESLSRRLFADAQKYIYIVDGLSHLVCASYKEDQYGVVQPMLPVIFATLLDLLDAVERHLKLCPIALRRPRNSASVNGEHLDVTLRFAFKSSIKSAIYRIVTTFQLHLNSLELSPEHKRRLRAFEDFKE